MLINACMIMRMCGPKVHLMPRRRIKSQRPFTHKNGAVGRMIDHDRSWGTWGSEKTSRLPYVIKQTCIFVWRCPWGVRVWQHLHATMAHDHASPSSKNPHGPFKFPWPTPMGIKCTWGPGIKCTCGPVIKRTCRPHTTRACMRGQNFSQSCVFRSLSALIALVIKCT